MRSAASNPFPSHVFDETGAPLPTAISSKSSGAAAGTRGRDTETDYHKHVGGKDDISHFIRRIQFKLHDSFPQPVRTCDRPPYQVSETGWGEFDIQIKIWWVAESGEKPLQTFHYLKLHPWHPLPVPAMTQAKPVVEWAATGTTGVATSDQAGPAVQSQRGGSKAADVGIRVSTAAIPGTAAEPTVTTMATGETAAGVTFKTDEEQRGMKGIVQENAATSGAAQKDAVNAASGTGVGVCVAAGTSDDAAAAAHPTIVLPPVVHSWQYDEVVFPEPTESFYQTLISHPPTPLPLTAAQAFTDPKTSRLQYGFNAADDDAVDGGGWLPSQPPYPLHAPSSQSYVYGISQQSMQAEADRLDIARIEAVRELERERTRLIEAEKELRIVRHKAEALTAVAAASHK